MGLKQGMPKVFWLFLDELGSSLNHQLFNTGVYPGGSDGKESTCHSGDPGSNPGSGRSPGEGNGNPLQYSYLENSMDRGAWQAIVHEVAKSQTQLSNLHFHFHKKKNNNQCIKLFAPTFRSHYIFLFTLEKFYIFISVPFHTIKLFQTICVHFALMFTCQFVEANFGFIAFSLQMAGSPNKFAVTISTWKLNQFWVVLWSSAFWSKCISIRIWMYSCYSGYSKPFELFICITRKNMTRYLSFGNIAHSSSAICSLSVFSSFLLVLVFCSSLWFFLWAISISIKSSIVIRKEIIKEIVKYFNQCKLNLDFGEAVGSG